MAPVRLLALSLGAVCAAASSLRMPSRLDGVSKTDIIVVTQDMMAAAATAEDKNAAWTAMLDAAAGEKPPTVDRSADLSPALRHVLHAAAAPNSPFAIAERTHTLAPTENGQLFVAKSIVQHKPNTWCLSDVLVALKASHLECHTKHFKGAPSLLHLTASRNKSGVIDDAVARLGKERAALYNAHQKIAVAAHKLTSNTQLPVFESALKSALSGLAASGTPVLFDLPSAAMLKEAKLSTCAAALAPNAFVVSDSHLDAATGNWEAWLRPVASFTEAFQSADIKFATEHDFDGKSVPERGWWADVLDMSPTAVHSVLGGLSDCILNSGDNSPCTFSINNFPAASFNYDSGTGKAASSLSLNSGVSCDNCWASLTASLAGGVQFCVNIGDTFTPSVGSGQCGSSSTLCPSEIDPGCSLYLNVSAILGGDLEVELDLTAGPVPAGTAATKTFSATAISGPSIPIPGLQAIGASFTPAFVLSSAVTVSQSTFGLNGTADWSVHAGTGANGLQAGFQFDVWAASTDDIVSLNVNEDFNPIFNANPTVQLNSPYVNGLAATAMTAQLALVPQVQLNLSVGYTLDSDGVSATAPFTVAPSVYVQLQTGAAGSSSPNGVAKCTQPFDSWYSLSYGSDLTLTWSGVSLTADAGPLSGTYQIVAAKPPYVEHMVNPTLFPGASSSGCVSSTWVAPSASPAPGGGGGSGNAGSSSGPSGAAVAGGVIGALLGVALIGGGGFFAYKRFRAAKTGEVGVEYGQLN